MTKGKLKPSSQRSKTKSLTRASGRVPEKVGLTFAEAVILYLKRVAKSASRTIAKIFCRPPNLKIDQAAIDAAAMALYPDGSSSTRNRQVYTPISAVLNVRSKFHCSGWKIRTVLFVGLLRLGQPLIASCSPHLKPLVMFMLYTGARAGEALWLDPRNVDLNRAHVSFEKTKG